MRFLVLALFALVAVASAAPIDIIDSSNIDAEFNTLNQWASFKATYNKNYGSQELEQYRFNIFKTNMDRAAQLMKTNPKAKFGANQFADLDPVEFKRQYLNYRPPMGADAVAKKHMKVTQPKSSVAAKGTPPTSDWRNKGAITAVKDQGQCGSCWAFSVTETIETAWFLAGNTLPTLAPEQIVDCDTAGQDQGCNGGDPVETYQVYVNKYGMQTEDSYPYTAGESGSAGSCAYNSSAVVTTPIKSFTYATPGCQDSCTNQDELTLAKNIASNGPSSICVSADVWQTYTGGILSSDCPQAYSSLDHCVQLVGLGNDGQNTYWIARNSWSNTWGENGFIRVLYGQNLCGIADEATYVHW